MEDCREASFFEMDEWIREEIDLFTYQEYRDMVGFWPYGINF